MKMKNIPKSIDKLRRTMVDPTFGFVDDGFKVAVWLFMVSSYFSSKDIRKYCTTHNFCSFQFSIKFQRQQRFSRQNFVKYALNILLLLQLCVVVVCLCIRILSRHLKFSFVYFLYQKLLFYKLWTHVQNLHPRLFVKIKISFSKNDFLFGAHQSHTT